MKTTTTSSKTKQKPSKRKISPKKIAFHNEDTQQFLQSARSTKTANSMNFSKNIGEETNGFQTNEHFFHFDVNKLSNLSTKQKSEAYKKKGVNNVLNSMDLASRYEEIIGEQTDFLLPRKYKMLLNKFELLLRKIFCNHLAHKKSCFESLRYELQNESISLTLKDLQQIFFIDNETFILNKSRKKLYIELNNFENNMKKNNIEEFVKEKVLKMREFFVELIKVSHFQFLKMNGLERDYFLYESQRVWHWDFPLDRMPDIPLSDLNLGELKENLFKTPIKKKIESPKRIEIKGDSIQDKILEAIRVKEENFMKEQKTHAKFSPELKIILYFAKLIHEYFKKRNVNCMFKVNVVAHLKENSNFYNLKQNEVQLYLDKIIATFPEWIHMIKDEMGSILQINKNFSLRQINKVLSSYFS